MDLIHLKCSSWRGRQSDALTWTHVFLVCGSMCVLAPRMSASSTASSVPAVPCAENNKYSNIGGAHVQYADRSLFTKSKAAVFDTASVRGRMSFSYSSQIQGGPLHSMSANEALAY